MDELTLTPVSKKEETPQENKPSADSFEMAPISLNTNGAKDATEAAFEELNTKDIKSLMEQEKLERQKAKEAAANPAPPAPAPAKPQGGENAKNKITEIMLTPPEDVKKEEPKAEEKPQENKEEKAPENQNKGGNQNNNNNNKNKNKNKGG
ncbi:MAG: hypothetical protein IJ330_07100, partial [Oscillospiraceae bacterium]|nr:hypothetical protein [Oscillospiraceae bacterium]